MRPAARRQPFRRPIRTGSQRSRARRRSVRQTRSWRARRRRPAARARRPRERELAGARHHRRHDRRERAQQRGIHERHADFDAVRHARPVGVAQQLVAHVMGRFERADPPDIAARIGPQRRADATAAGAAGASPRAPSADPAARAARTAGTGRGAADRRRPSCANIQADRPPSDACRRSRERSGSQQHSARDAQAPERRQRAETATPARQVAESSDSRPAARRRRGPTARP